MICEQISFIFVLATGLFLSYFLSWIIVFFYESYAKEKYKNKIYTFEDAEYLEDFLNRNIPIFVLFSKKEDTNNKFYLEELKKISQKYEYKYHFALLAQNERVEKVIYLKVFNSKIVDFPQFAIIEKDKIDIIDKVDKKELIQQIEKKMKAFDLSVLQREEKQKEIEQKEKEDKEKEDINKNQIEEDVE